MKKTLRKEKSGPLSGAKKLLPFGKEERYPDIAPPAPIRPQTPEDEDAENGDTELAKNDMIRGAVYTIYTSPNPIHAAPADHLPTLIVTPYDRPHDILYTYLHTNFNSEQYLLTPSPKGDLCIARMLPPAHNTVSKRKGKEHPPIKCEASRQLKWHITNTGVFKPTYLLTIPAPKDGSGIPEQPLFKVTKINPSAPFWTMFYFVYAGHQIPPRTVEFGKILKNPAKAGGGTRVSIHDDNAEARNVWNTLGENNEDMVEWIVLSAALTVLDDEIIKAAKDAEGSRGLQRLRPERRRSVSNDSSPFTHSLDAEGPSNRERLIKGFKPNQQQQQQQQSHHHPQHHQQPPLQHRPSTTTTSSSSSSQQQQGQQPHQQQYAHPMRSNTQASRPPPTRSNTDYPQHPMPMPPGATPPPQFMNQRAPSVPPQQQQHQHQQQHPSMQRHRLEDAPASRVPPGYNVHPQHHQHSQHPQQLNRNPTVSSTSSPTPIPEFGALSMDPNAPRPTPHPVPHGYPVPTPSPGMPPTIHSPRPFPNGPSPHPMMPNGYAPPHNLPNPQQQQHQQVPSPLINNRPQPAPAAAAASYKPGSRPVRG